MCFFAMARAKTRGCDNVVEPAVPLDIDPTHAAGSAGKADFAKNPASHEAPIVFVLWFSHPTCERLMITYKSHTHRS